MTNIQSQSTSNPTSISQVAAETGLNGDQAFIREMVKAFKERHDYVLAELNSIPGVSCLSADGAFYLFPNAEGAIAKLGLADDVALSEYLIENAGVALVPGSAFGAPGHVRLSIATSMANLQKAMERLKAGLA